MHAGWEFSEVLFKLDLKLIISSQRCFLAFFLIPMVYMNNITRKAIFVFVFFFHDFERSHLR